MPVETRSFAIQGRSDVVVAGSQGRRFAVRHGFDVKRATEIAIVVSELGSNIVKHGVKGELRLLWDPETGEIAVEAHDVGPPIHDLQLAMTDGYDDRGPLDPALILRRGGRIRPPPAPPRGGRGAGRGTAPPPGRLPGVSPEKRPGGGGEGADGAVS